MARWQAAGRPLGRLRAFVTNSPAAWRSGQKLRGAANICAFGKAQRDQDGELVANVSPPASSVIMFPRSSSCAEIGPSCCSSASMLTLLMFLSCAPLELRASADSQARALAWHRRRCPRLAPDQAVSPCLPAGGGWHCGPRALGCTVTNGRALSADRAPSGAERATSVAAARPWSACASRAGPALAEREI